MESRNFGITDMLKTVYPHKTPQNFVGGGGIKSNWHDSRNGHANAKHIQTIMLVVQHYKNLLWLAKLCQTVIKSDKIINLHQTIIIDSFSCIWFFQQLYLNLKNIQ